MAPEGLYGITPMRLRHMEEEEEEERDAVRHSYGMDGIYGIWRLITSIAPLL